MEHTNLVSKILSIGYKEIYSSKYSKLEYNPKNNWLGVSHQHPDAIFKKDGSNIKVTLSFQGMLMPMNYPEEASELVKNMQSRYICIEDKGVKMYETFVGIIPSKEIVSKIFNI